MAIIGGAGNPVGGSFTGAAEALEIIGNHAYAYSGPVTDAGSGAPDTTILKFTSGNYYSVLQMSHVTDAMGGNHQYMDILLNDVTIYQGIWDSGQVHSIVDQPFNILIPPYTKFEVKWGIQSVTKAISVLMVGRIYRTRD